MWLLWIVGLYLLIALISSSEDTADQISKMRIEQAEREKRTSGETNGERIARQNRPGAMFV